DGFRDARPRLEREPHAGRLPIAGVRREVREAREQTCPMHRMREPLERRRERGAAANASALEAEQSVAPTREEKEPVLVCLPRLRVRRAGDVRRAGAEPRRLLGNPGIANRTRAAPSPPPSARIEAG